MEIAFVISQAHLDDYPDEPFINWVINADEMQSRECSASLRDIAVAPRPAPLAE